MSDHWEALGPARFYETFGPELSFAHRLAAHDDSAIAIGKFTHSGSQILDWTPEGSIAEDRNLYGKWISFIKDCLRDLEGKGHDVELAGIVYHMGENDMCFYPYKKNAVARLSSIIKQSRVDLNESELKWLVSSQQPFPNESLEQLDVANELRRIPCFAETDPHGVKRSANETLWINNLPCFQSISGYRRNRGRRILQSDACSLEHWMDAPFPNESLEQSNDVWVRIFRCSQKKRFPWINNRSPVSSLFPGIEETEVDEFCNQMPTVSSFSSTGYAGYFTCLPTNLAIFAWVLAMSAFVRAT